jgi:hypothetical protein
MVCGSLVGKHYNGYSLYLENQGFQQQYTIHPIHKLFKYELIWLDHFLLCRIVGNG